MDKDRILALAKRIGEADDMILRTYSSDDVGNTDFKDEYVSGEDHNLIVEALYEV